MADEGAGDWEARVNWHKKLERRRLGRRQLAQGIRRARRHRHAAHHLSRGTRPARAQRAVHRHGHQPARPDADSLGHRGAEETPHPENPRGRGNLVPGLLGTRLGIRPRVAADARGRAMATTSSSTGRRSGPRWRSTPTGSSCWCAPIPTRPSTRASAICWSTCTAPASPCVRWCRSPAASGFNEVFFEDVRVPKKNIVGELNQGWQVAITTLMFERAGGSGEVPISRSARAGATSPSASRATAATRGTIRACGRRSPSSPARREALQVHRLSATDASVEGNSAGARRLDDEAVQHRAAPADGDVRDGTARAVQPDGIQRAVRSRSRASGHFGCSRRAARRSTPGTNQIQHNIIGERVLGLPKG